MTDIPLHVSVVICAYTEARWDSMMAGVASLQRQTIPLLEIMPYEPADALMRGGQTQEQAQGFYQSLLAGAPKITVVPIAPSRHFVMLDQPEALNKSINDFLTSVQR